MRDTVNLSRAFSRAWPFPVVSWQKGHFNGTGEQGLSFLYTKTYAITHWYLLLVVSYAVSHRCNVVEFVSLWWRGRCFPWFIIQHTALWVTLPLLVINGTVALPRIDLAVNIWRVLSTGNTDSLLWIRTAHQFFFRSTIEIYGKKVHLGSHLIDCLVQLILWLVKRFKLFDCS